MADVQKVQTLRTTATYNCYVQPSLTTACIAIQTWRLLGVHLARTRPTSLPHLLKPAHEPSIVDSLLNALGASYREQT